MAKIGTEKVVREPGYLYYLGKDGHVWRTPMRSNPHGTKRSMTKEKIVRKYGCLYYLGKDGYVHESGIPAMHGMKCPKCAYTWKIRNVHLPPKNCPKCKASLIR